jgi:protease IV
VIRRILVGFLATLGFLVVLGAALGYGAYRWMSPERPVLAERTIVTLDLTNGLSEARSEDPLEGLVFEREPSLRDVVEGIGRAARDSRVVGLFARVGDDEHGFATVQELRTAIEAFRKAGKPAVVFADSFGEFGPGLRSYYLASAFDEIWLQPMGSVGLAGIRSENPFLRGVAEQLGIEPRFERREEYKTAFNNFTERGFTQAHKEELEQLLGSIYRQVAGDIAAARKLEPAEAERLLGAGPWLAKEAEAARLVDRIGWRDEAFETLRARTGGQAMPVLDYLERVGRPYASGTRVALIVGAGAVQRGEVGGGILGGETVMSAEALVSAFRQAVADPQVKAILFRVDSPGGSAVASETIWRETIRAKEAGKPVIVSMGDLAGSGGYYVAAGATKIVAHPATLTGSIGVIAGKVVTRQMWEKLGVNWDWVGFGVNSGMFSLIEDFTPEQQQRFNAELDSVYATFKSRVGEGRKMSPDQVEAVAKGRVWTGREAKEKGLVDALGGYSTALELIRETLGLAADAPIELRPFPPEREPLDFLWAKLLGEEPERKPATRTAFLRALAPVIRMVSPPGPLTMLPLEPR